ncbi:GNAT family N-acetyltransferase [Quisquiliibacterium transsilvanicum]|uniref:RimJ/RimL family protein N-acetyltransferase n=1 Tax=Quisquiliibacterium transsilvanicum TaxID=1549638 RepID=A0A7W8HFT4_9BURK|nr:GNAT family protein [Quisquiliibacterium transsilvanicum]MBB5271322.1 RimJ/RimL family protein N-acetyltransferase [Quisquiliibacterium transsilvanicum]
MLVYDLDAVHAFMKGRIPGLHRCDDMQAIGWEERGQLVAGVLYEGFNPHNVWMHVAAVPGARWMRREYLRACFAYPFLVCGVERISGYVNESNWQARGFDEHLGFKEEARLRGAAPDGGDVIIYVMRREDCRYVQVPQH